MPGSSLCVLQVTGAICLLLFSSRFARTGPGYEIPWCRVLGAAEAPIVSLSQSLFVYAFNQGSVLKLRLQKSASWICEKHNPQAACTSPRRKFPKARLPGREGIFIPLKFSVRALPSAQENLQSEENDPSFSSGASTLSMT